MSLNWWYTVDGWNPANQLRLVVHPIIYRVFYIPCHWLFGISSINGIKGQEFVIAFWPQVSSAWFWWFWVCFLHTWCYLVPMFDKEKSGWNQCWNLTTKGMNQIWKIFLLYSFSGVPITRLTLCLATAVGDNLPVTDNLSTWNLDVQLIFTGSSCFFGDNNLWVKSRFFFDIRLRFFQFEVPSF